jgi:hypothetical protein
VTAAGPPSLQAGRERVHSCCSFSAKFRSPGHQNDHPVSVPWSLQKLNETINVSDSSTLYLILHVYSYCIASQTHCITQLSDKIRCRNKAICIQLTSLAVPQDCKRTNIMKSLLETVFNWFNDDQNRELEAYLSQAANPADVDRLLRQWENRDKSFFHLP